MIHGRRHGARQSSRKRTIAELEGGDGGKSRPKKHESAPTRRRPNAMVVPAIWAGGAPRAPMGSTRPRAQPAPVVLVVDDSAVARLTVARRLRADGFEVLEHASVALPDEAALARPSPARSSTSTSEPTTGRSSRRRFAPGGETFRSRSSAAHPPTRCSVARARSGRFSRSRARSKPPSRGSGPTRFDAAEAAQLRRRRRRAERGSKGLEILGPTNGSAL